MKKDILQELSEKNNGYLFTSDVVKSGISKPYLAEFIKKNGYEKVAHGIYVSADVWPDELFILQRSNPLIVYSGETAFYSNDMIDREYSKIQVSVPKGYNAAHLRKRGVTVRFFSEKVYSLGIAQIESMQGNIISVYDKERCVCDAIRDRKELETQVFQTVIKEYISDNNKNMTRLIKYAEVMNLRDEVMKYVEVLL